MTVINGAIHVHLATGVVDCGQVVHPDLVAAQLEGGIIFGMAAGLMDAITVKDGRVEQSNFTDFPMPLMADAPEFEIVHMPSTQPSGGIGEVSVGPTAPAIANAIYEAIGVRITDLPISPEKILRALDKL